MNYRKTKIFLTLMPPWGVQTPPVGIASISTYLKKQGVSVKVSDFNISLYNSHKSEKQSLWDPGNKVFWVMPDHFKNILEAFSADIEKLVDNIISEAYDFVCFSVFSDNRLFTIEVIKQLRSKKFKGKIIVGGVGCYSEKEQKSFPEDIVDAFVIGEGEGALLELIKYYSDDIKTAPANVVTKDFPFKSSAEKSKLDSFGFPDFADFNLDDYTNRSIAVTFSRGCVMQCLYCNDRKIMGSYRQKSAEAMFEQIKYYVEKKGIKEFAINDLQLNADVKRLNDFCDRIIKAKLKITWTANMMPSDKMDASLVRKLKQAGCSSVIFGVESASENVLKNMNRKFTTATAVDILKNFYKEGIEAWVNVIVGYPGETKKDFEKTLKFLEDNRKYISKVSVLNKCNIVQNSQLYSDAAKFGILFPADKSYEEVRWTSLSGNSETLRDLRLQRTIIALDKLNVPVLQTNVKYSDPIAEDDELTAIFGDIAFVRDSRNIMVEETDEKAAIVNAYLKSINEILDYKEIQIREIIEYKHKEIKKISEENATEKKKIAKTFDDKIKDLVKEAEEKLKNTVSVKDAEIEKLSHSYILREEKLVEDNDRRIADMVKRKDQEFEHRFNSFKSDMEQNIIQKERLLMDMERQRATEVQNVVANKDEEIESLTKEHVFFIEDIVSKKDKEITDINNKYQNLIYQREKTIVDLSKTKKEIEAELLSLKQSKWFRLRMVIRKYLFF